MFVCSMSVVFTHVYQLLILHTLRVVQDRTKLQCFVLRKVYLIIIRVFQSGVKENSVDQFNHKNYSNYYCFQKMELDQNLIRQEVLRLLSCRRQYESDCQAHNPCQNLEHMSLLHYSIITGMLLNSFILFLSRDQGIP